MEILIFTECNGSPGFGRDAGAYTVASRLRDAGFSVQVIDFFSFIDEQLMMKLVRKFVSDETLFVGFSSTHITTSMPDNKVGVYKKNNRTQDNNSWNVYFPFSQDRMENYFNIIKSKNPQVKILVGGQKVIQKQNLQRSHPGVDIWVSGNADVSVVQIARRLKKGEDLRGKLFEWEFPKFENFNSTPTSWHSNDLIHPDEALPLEISRSCPMNCAFCDFPKKRRGELTKSYDVVKFEILNNYERHGTKRYFITDPLVNESLEKMSMIAELFTSLPFDIEWSGFIRLDLLKKYPEMVSMIERSGAKCLQFGIESNNDSALKRVGKRMPFSEIEELLMALKQRWGDKILLCSGFVLGLPGDTEESIQDLFCWLSSSKLLHYFEITPLFIGPYNKSREPIVHFSQIQKNPGAWGYEIGQGVDGCGRTVENWLQTETGLTKFKCVELLEEFQKGEAWKNRLIGAAYSYMRCRNLGFSHEENLLSTANNNEFIETAIERYKELGEKYFENLFRKIC
ncbi:MAG: hypothetical protein CL676_00185 [Bdellovibrionaceae bacterium]|nr:hypothetical protein [Pseudobdellovibrionaceae bacterium]|tara:strand:+ start:1491 stop:3023 length:1533 start_codon:yes stop_codon:yes gene_type:complete